MANTIKRLVIGMGIGFVCWFTTTVAGHFHFRNETYKGELNVRAIQKADTNNNGQIDADEALNLYKCLGWSGERVYGLLGIDAKKELIDSKKRLLGTKKCLLDTKKEHLVTKIGLLDTKKAQKNTQKYFSDIFLPLIVLVQLDVDFIPGPDGDFDEWQKNYVKRLSLPWPPADEGAPALAAAVPVMPLSAYLGIPAERFTELIAEQLLWNKDYARGGKESDRKSSYTKAKQKTRRDYVNLLRSVTAEYIHRNRKATDEIKRALKVNVPDTEPTPIHGTDAPVVGLKNAGGSVIDIRCKRSEDQTRVSMLKGYQIEVRYVVGPPSPTDPDMSGMKTEISGKAHFKITAGMLNLGKTFYCYLRWRSKTTAAFNSPWTNLLQIIIA